MRKYPHLFPSKKRRHGDNRAPGRRSRTCGELDAFVSIPDEGDMAFLQKKVKSGAAVGKRVLLQLVKIHFPWIGKWSRLIVGVFYLVDFSFDLLLTPKVAAPSSKNGNTRGVTNSNAGNYAPKQPSNTFVASTSQAGQNLNSKFPVKNG
ncbi:hypothetical protein Tco_1059100, partial [Tanacetum coccineum]